MRTNKKSRDDASLTTHEGAAARYISVLAQLRRSVLSCLLWESEFYEDGVEIGQRIAQLTAQCLPEDVAALAVEAREQMHLRHVPLLLLRELARHPLLKDRPQLLSKTMGKVLQRADEPAEFLALYWKDKKQPLSKQVKRGLAWSMRRFGEHDLAKYNRDAEVTLRDVLFMSHAKPKDEAQAALWKKLAANELATPDTWEVQLSAGADKKETFERLIREKKLGYFALIRNLRNMEEAGVDVQLVREAILARKGGADKLLPFRYVAAARHAKQFELQLDTAMQAALAELPKLAGTTIVLVDNSGSMSAQLSRKSEMTRADAAAGVAIVVRGVCEAARVFAFSDNCVEVPPRNGMALRDAIRTAARMGSTQLGAAVTLVGKLPHDRLIVITDEQSADRVLHPQGLGYMINVASNRNGVGYGKWLHVDGWSDAVVRFITEHERTADASE
jgi:60 kDa SS-A/Ro ribonucleoprotein